MSPAAYLAPLTTPARQRGADQIRGRVLLAGSRWWLAGGACVLAVAARAWAPATPPGPRHIAFDVPACPTEAAYDQVARQAARSLHDAFALAYAAGGCTTLRAGEAVHRVEVHLGREVFRRVVDGRRWWTRDGATE